MDVVVTSPAGVDVGSTAEYSLDISVGSSGNNFELSISGVPIERGSLVAIEGTEFGGVVDSLGLDVISGISTKRWMGRSWQGILYGHLLRPDDGKDYLTVSGEANAVLMQLVARMGLSSVFSVDTENSGIQINHQFERPCENGYDGLVNMLGESGAVLMIRREDGITRMWAAPSRTVGSIDSDRMNFKLERAWRPVNHLMCAGTGELSDRAVVDFYADENGNVSHTQTLFGIDEVAELYDYSNADEEQLEEEGKKKLVEYQQQGSVDVNILPGEELCIGDHVLAVDRETGTSVTAVVSKKIARGSNGVVTVTYECGDANTGAQGGVFSAGESPNFVTLAQAIDLTTIYGRSDG